MTKRKLTLSIEEETIKKLKKAAIDKGITVSDMLVDACATSKFITPEYKENKQ